MYHPAGGTPVVVERVSLPVPADPAEDHYYAKNDPRVPIFPYVGPNRTLNERNCEVNQGFNPNIGGEVPGWAATPPGAPGPGWTGHFNNHFNRYFANPGELGYIHTGGQWETIAMRDIAGRNAVEIARHHQLLDRFTINHPYNRMGRININTASFDILTRLPQMRVQGGVQAQRIINRRGTNPFNTIGEAVPFLTPDTDPVELSEEVNQLMQDLVNLVNWVIHWPSTWEWWVFEEWGDNLHNYFITTIGTELDRVNQAIEPDIPFYTPPVCSVCGYPTLYPCHCGGSPAYITLEHEITIAIVEGVAEAIVNTTNHVIDWMRRNLGFWWPIEELSEWGINTLLNPILERGNALFRYTITGTDLDGDYFYGEDDELETIVRSISNLITTRSDRFDIVSTGYVMRGGEELAKSQMRAIVCRITPPV
ncbi:hypothetical protein LR007_04500, partial [candidate division NPL-UPA2 bacterium]|nr:hypothetical protein [candidate division NPL-UPA2 bacterium]